MIRSIASTWRPLKSTLMHKWPHTLPPSSHTFPKSYHNLSQSSHPLSQSSNTLPKFSHTLFQSSHTLCQFSHTLSQSSHTLCQFSHTLSQSSHTLPQYSHTLHLTSEALGKTAFPLHTHSLHTHTLLSPTQLHTLSHPSSLHTLTDHRPSVAPHSLQPPTWLLTTHSTFSSLADGEKPKTTWAKLKQMVKDYWYIIIPVEIATSVVWYASFYLALRSGFDIAALLEQWGASEATVARLPSAEAGYHALAFICYKVVSPLRHGLSLAVSSVIVARLEQTRPGYLRTSGQLAREGKEAGESARERYSEAREEARDRYSEAKEEARERYSEAREEAKEKYSEARERTGEMREQLEDRKGELKEQFLDRKEELKDNLEKLKKKLKDK